MNKQQKINFFDTLAGLLLIAIIGLGIFTYTYKSPVPNARILLTMKTVTPDASVIEPTAQAQSTVFFNSVDTAVKVISVQQVGTNLLITMEAPGSIAENKDVFNGQRVLIGSKAEIHGNYFAQGIITEVKNEN